MIRLFFIITAILLDGVGFTFKYKSITEDNVKKKNLYTTISSVVIIILVISYFTMKELIKKGII